jgi:lysylphosphatidylglycerol synthetase-like protein (DUF2156 family)
VAFALLLAAAVLHLTKDLDVEQAAFALLLAAVLWLRRQDYQAESDAPSPRRGYLALALGVALATGYSVGGVLVLHRQLHHPPVIWHAHRTSLRLAAIQHLHLHHAATPHAAWFVQSGPVLSAVALMYGVAMIVRPAILRGATAEDRARMRELVHVCGLNPLAPYALPVDKFNPRWDERFLAYPAAVPLATVIAPVVRVHLAPRLRAKRPWRLNHSYPVPARVPA